ncbi:MAG TPA: amidohydrolase family protein [Pseudolysinimonas sp.]|nr:amidohydrolase family protein [Pseudolysinimonas sp.]
MTGSPGSIDVHHHILPPEYVAAVGADVIGSQGSSGKLPNWSLEGSLELMDAAGIATAITSVSSPGLLGLGPNEAVDLARWCNDFATGMATDHPGRFGVFATLPLHSEEAATAEADRALGELNADGVCLLTNYEGEYLGEQRFAPLYEELDRHEAVVFVHPTTPFHRLDIAGMSQSMMEFPFDTTRTIASLLFGGVFTKYPSIRWIFSHAGGTLPYLAGRLEVLLRNNEVLRNGIGGELYETLGSLFFDTALSVDPGHLGSLRALVDDSQILFGTDYPFGPKDQMESTVARLTASDLSSESQEAIHRGNASGLFSRFAS